MKIRLHDLAEEARREICFKILQKVLRLPQVLKAGRSLVVPPRDDSRGMTLIVTFFALLILPIPLFAQQAPQQSQYMFEPLLLSPAYAGSKDHISTSLLYRNQWANLQGSPETSGLTIHSPVKGNMGLGLQIMNDNIGPKSTTGILGSYAYRLPYKRGKFAFGLRYGIYQYNYNFSKVELKDLEEFDNGSLQSKSIIPTADFGVYYFDRDFYAGLSYTNLLKGRTLERDFNQFATADLSRHIFATAGKAYKLNNMIFSPSFLIKYAANAPIDVDVNFNVLFERRLWAGMSYRTGYGLVFMSQYLITKNLKIGYAFDLALNSIRSGIGGSHEVMIGYDFYLFRSKVLSPRYL